MNCYNVGLCINYQTSGYGLNRVLNFIISKCTLLYNANVPTIYYYYSHHEALPVQKDKAQVQETWTDCFTSVET